MVSFVVVSHSEKLAEGVADLMKMVAREVKVIPAGGLPDGSYGTSYDRISEALKEAMGPDGVIVLVDLGSAVMTAEMAMEELDSELVKIADGPLAEGAVVGAIRASIGADLTTVLDEIEKAAGQKKL